MGKIKKHICFNISNVNQALEVVSICNANNIIPVFYIKYYIINRLGTDWVIEFRNLLLLQYTKNKFKFFVNCKKNYGLFIKLVSKKINFLQITGDSNTLTRIKQIADKNKTNINPKFDIIDLKKIKNIRNKIMKHNQKNI